MESFKKQLAALLRDSGADEEVFTEYICGMLEDGDIDASAADDGVEDDNIGEISGVLESAVDDASEAVTVLSGRILALYKDCLREESSSCSIVKGEKEKDALKEISESFELQSETKPSREGAKSESEFRSRQRLIEMYGDEEEAVMDDEGNVMYEDKDKATASAASTSTGGSSNLNCKMAAESIQAARNEQKRANEMEQQRIKEASELQRKAKERQKARTQKREKRQW